jgi:hypothetical protein
MTDQLTLLFNKRLNIKYIRRNTASYIDKAKRDRYHFKPTNEYYMIPHLDAFSAVESNQGQGSG